MFQKRTSEGYLTTYGAVILPLGVALMGGLAFGAAGATLSEALELDSETSIGLTVMLGTLGGLVYFAQGYKEGTSK